MGPKKGANLRFATLNVLLPLHDYAGTELGLNAEHVGRSLLDNYISPAGLVSDFQEDTLAFLNVSWQNSTHSFTWRRGIWVL